ncbi:FAD:protein FMN transferase [candidate division KSB1 bacterium]|nr:FAD:protein FMN transferase [candidate division KSB1 bacterium]
MATIFEVLICHNEKKYARQAAQEAFFELDRLEQDFSRFIKNSDISRINHLSINESTRVSTDTFECLLQCADLYVKTKGAFDITVGSLMKCWLNEDKALLNPTKKEIELAKQRTGLFHILLDETHYSVKMLSGPIYLDLGGFGKGYAVDQMAELLNEWSINKFLIHGGKSSVLAGEAPEEKKGWQVSITSPFHNQVIDKIWLKNQAMSGSGLQKGFHIIDPRTAHPVKTNRAVWAFAATAAKSDGLSTAFFIMDPDDIEIYCSNQSNITALIAIKDIEGKSSSEKIFKFGDWK